MNNLPKLIPKQPAINPAEDYYRLRRDGIGFIEKTSSRLWTDYNTHDPGITILEALCYAITDVAYRVGWDIKDILAPETSAPDQSQPYPNQAFFTAKNILTVNPTTPDDLRRLLIDLAGVRNAWVFCKDCSCNVPYYAWCEKDQLRLSYQKPDYPLAQEPIKVEPRGLYDVSLELESDPDLGDLNDHKIEHVFFFEDGDGGHSVLLEVRFPGTNLANDGQWALLLTTSSGAEDFDYMLQGITLERMGTTKTTNIFTDIPDEDDRNEYLRKHWNMAWYLDLEIRFIRPQSAEIIFKIENVTLRLFSNAEARAAATAGSLKALFENNTAGDGIIERYRRKALVAQAAVSDAKKLLHTRRNLDEDFCRVSVVNVEDVAVCADVEVTPGADIERVQANIWFEIERYFNPPVPFNTMQELIDAGEAAEEIFNGPSLESGFIKAGDLEAASLKSVLRVSDIINLLMDIDGVIAVNQVQLVKYDAEGNIVAGAADPTWDGEGKPVFNAAKTNASWLMYIGKYCQPRLYLNASRFLFYKNGLPFLPRMDEAHDTLTLLRGEAERPKVKNAPDDLTAPTGTFRNPEEYFPVQYGFPLMYGIGTEGLPSHASSARRAQAKQLKAYLLVFEQVLGNAIAQVAHAADLFSLDPLVQRTYFVKEFSEAIIQGYNDIVHDLDKPKLEAIVESGPEFHERRNRFLDHVMARFGEQFSEYALLLTNMLGQQIALDRLIEDKISFISAYPLISRDRGKAFNYRVNPVAPDNIPGIQTRVARLLGWSGNERAIVVEHLLLRPKFPGDALYPACSDGACATCGDEDPYSFRLTFVMPGWLPPYDKNLELRDFADRTIKQEIPSHLLAKVCWVSNDGFEEKDCEPVIDELARLLADEGHTAGGAIPATEEVCGCATAIYHAFSGIFRDWYEDKKLYYIHSDALKAALEADFKGKADFSGIACAIILDTKLQTMVQTLMVGHFQEIALYGWQFDRFEDAWRAWLEANAVIDWTEERLQERVEMILASSLTTNAAADNVTKEKVCDCAADVLMQFGSDFYEWMYGKIKDGKALEELGALPDFSLIPLCDNFTSEAAGKITDLLKERYATYVEVSYRLWMVVGLLGKLRNAYPVATLHDWDEGNDENPVRLGKTALGS